MIQIAMLIVGLYAIIVGKFGLGKRVYLQGKRARIAGLILLIPVLFVVCSVLSLIGAELTGGFINGETLEREVDNSERGVWSSALMIALAYVSFYTTSRETKTQGGCLRYWLLFTAFIATMGIYFYFRTDFMQTVYPSTPSWILITLTSIGILQVIFCIAIWKWKKWGVFGFVTTVVIQVGIALLFSNFVLPALFQLSPIVVVGLLVKPKWQFFE